MCGVKLIIAGGRKFSNGALFNQSIAEFMAEHGQPDEIICGMAKGVDTLGWL